MDLVSALATPRRSRLALPTSGWGGGRGGGQRGGGDSEKIWAGRAAGTLNKSPIHINSRLTKHTYSYNLHVKRYPIHTIEEY